MDIVRSFKKAVDNGPVSLTSIIGFSAGVVAILAGVIASPLIYLSDKNESEFEKRVVLLDKSSVIFNSVAQCTSQGYAAKACERSQDEALDIAQSMGTVVSYGDYRSCVKNHSHCAETTMSDMTFVGTSISTSYKPHVAAWQALAKDLGSSVPLYTGSNAGIVVRRDGRQFKIQ